MAANEWVPSEFITAAYDQILQNMLRTAPDGHRMTDEEMAENKRKWEARKPLIDAARDRVDAALASILHPALRAVIDLHGRDGVECAGCDAGSYAESSPWWPCTTIRTLAPFVGIEESDLNLL